VTGTIAVTGASGYVGGRLVAAAPGARCLVRKRAPHLPADDQVELDLMDPGAALAHALEGVDSVVHLAGHNEVVAAREPDLALTETVTAARHVAEAAAAVGARRLVYVSTVHVYGRHMGGGARLDEDTPPAPTSTYATARLASEHLVGEAAAAGTEVVVLRLTNAVGAPSDVAVDRWTLVASDLCRQAVRTGELVLRTSGRQVRDFVALGDVVDAVRCCADTGGGIRPGTYNLGAGETRSILDLAAVVQDRFEARGAGRPAVRTTSDEPREADPYVVDVGRLAAAGWRATTPLVDAVDELVAFCMEHEDELR
jgi:UDP-glucose 4-epimerase